MAQTGKTPISLYYSATGGNTPTAGNLVDGELAINTADGKLFYKDSSGVVQTVASKDANAGTFTSVTTTNLTVNGNKFGAGDSAMMKNRIINGAMQVWQRGTSSSSTGYQTVDRWSFYADSSRTISRSTDVPTGFQYSTSLSGTGSTGLTQKIESLNCYGIAGNSITISFWLKQTTGAGSNAIGLNLYYANAADDWNASTQISTTQNFTTTTGWAQYSATFTNMPANSVNGLQVTIVTTSGSAVVFLLAGVQLEVGSTASSFDYRPYGTELMLCQRYYEKSWVQGTAVGASTSTGMVFTAAMSNASTTGYLVSGSQFKVTKRATPTMVYYDSVGASNACIRQLPGSGETNGSSVSNYNTGDSSIGMYSTSGVAASGVAFHYTASAEL